MKEFNEIAIKKLLKERLIVGKCWIHTGSTDKDGYGYISIYRKTYRANRLSAYLCLGLDLSDPKIFACHDCVNKACWNPLHLYVGTNSDNQNDLVNQNKHPQQLKTHCPKGHEYTRENTYINKRTPAHRSCRICRKIVNDNRSNVKN